MYTIQPKGVRHQVTCVPSIVTPAGTSHQCAISNWFLSKQKSAAEIFMAATMAFRSFLLFLVLGSMVLITGCERNVSSAQKTESPTSARSNLWRVYDRSLKGAKYIDLRYLGAVADSMGRRSGQGTEN